MDIRRKDNNRINQGCRKKPGVQDKKVFYLASAAALVFLVSACLFGVRTIVNKISVIREEKKMSENLNAKQTEIQLQTQPQNQPEAAGKTFSTDEVEYTDEELLNEAIKTILSQMTVEEKAAGMFMVTPEALTGMKQVTKAGDSTKAALDRYPVGGIVYFGGNIVSEEQFKMMVSATRDYAKYPLFLGIDEEGGKVARIANSKIGEEKVLSAGEIGKSGETANAYEAAKTIASYLSNYGLNLDFAPVADILTDPSNKTIGNRSFGTDKELVAGMVEQSVKGFENTGISSCLKHFPGLGGTKIDTHDGSEITYRTKKQLMETELASFQAGISAGVDLVMISHLGVPAITGDNTPSSLSYEVVTDILRGELGYDGIVVTDAMNMGAITKNYSSGEAAVKAIQAGVDLILMPGHFEEAYQAVLGAVKAGNITEDRIEESLERIYRVKYREEWKLSNK